MNVITHKIHDHHQCYHQQTNICIASIIIIFAWHCKCYSSVHAAPRRSLYSYKTRTYKYHDDI